jgi:hypothetical protein
MICVSPASNVGFGAYRVYIGPNFWENPQSIPKFRYPNKASNISPIKITPTIPKIQEPSRTVNCPTVFLLPLDGQWLCMRMVAKSSSSHEERHTIPVADCLRSFNGTVIVTPRIVKLN